MIFCCQAKKLLTFLFIKGHKIGYSKGYLVIFRAKKKVFATIAKTFFILKPYYLGFMGYLINADF